MTPETPPSPRRGSAGFINNALDNITGNNGNVCVGVRVCVCVCVWVCDMFP